MSAMRAKAPEPANGELARRAGAPALANGMPISRLEAKIPRARILVVDDDEHNLLAIRTVLEDIAEVEVAASGDEALRHLLKGEFAVILLDVFMPGMDGYETAQIIRGREQTKRIPIVFLSAVNKEKEHLIRGYSMGAVDYVFKPVEPIVLRSKVAVFVDLHEKSKEIERKAAAEQALLDDNLRAQQERLQIEQELRIAEQRQAAIIESLPIAIYIEDPQTNVRVPQVIGGRFTQLTGYELDEAKAQPMLFFERLHPDDREHVNRALEERVRTGNMAVEYRWRCADGSYKHFLDQAVLLRDAAGHPTCFAGTFLDVTERKELETQLLQAHKMDAIGKLTGGVAHDFNNLLAAVLGGLGMIERRVPLVEEQQKILDMTKRAAEQGSELVSRLLAFSRRQQLRPAEIDIRALSVSLTELLEHTLGGLVEVEWRIGEKVWPALADSTQLELALMNLIINARDAMPKGGTILVEAANLTVGADHDGLSPGDYVSITVSDQGTGIPPELLQRVTEPFFTTKEMGKGTGLGLSMVYGFARQSDGALDIQSEVGVGTRIALQLPRALESQVESVKPRKAFQRADSAPLKILLVDDHEGVRETTAGMLQDLGHEVQAVGDGVAALQCLKSGTGFDLVITDYAMPKMSGDEILRRARKDLPDLPAIIISGFPNSGANLADLGRVTVLAKPFTSDQMAGAIFEGCR